MWQRSAAILYTRLKEPLIGWAAPANAVLVPIESCWTEWRVFRLNINKSAMDVKIQLKTDITQRNSQIELLVDLLSAVS